MFEIKKDSLKMGLNKEGYKDTLIKPSEYDVYIDDTCKIILKCHNTKTISIENLSKEKAQEVLNIIIEGVNNSEDFSLPKIEKIFFNFKYNENKKAVPYLTQERKQGLKPRYENDLPYSVLPNEEHLYISLEDTLKNMQKNHFLYGYFKKQLEEKNKV